MNETKKLIIKGCQFIMGIGADKWESNMTKLALKRMILRCQTQLDEWDIPKEKEVTVDQMSHEQLKTIFKPL